MLVLTARYPYPVVGGDRLRIYYMCRELAKDYDLTLLSLCETRAEASMTVPEDGVFQRVERIVLPRWRSLINAAIALPSQTPMQVAYYRSRDFAERLNTLLPEHDACLAHLIRMGNYVQTKSEYVRVLEMTDAISLNYSRVKALGQPQSLKALVYMIEADRLLRYERTTLDHFDIVSLISQADRDFLLSGAHHPAVHICSNGVDLSKMPIRHRTPVRPVIVFIGNMLTIQNLDACDYFIRDILPLIRPRLDVTFRIVGRISQEQSKRLKQEPSVEVTGEVPNVADAVDDAWIGVCPMRLGAGVQNKVLEYMALALPAIVSQVGAEGLDAINDESLLVASHPQDWANQIIKLWAEPTKASALAKAGRTYVEQHHDWNNCFSGLRQAITSQINLRAESPQS